MGTRTMSAFSLIIQGFVVVIAILLAAPRLSSITPLPPSAFNLIESLKGKTIIITGGTSGVGNEAAKAFAEAGAKLVITGRSADRAKLAALKLPGNDHVGLPLDLTDPASINAFSDALRKLRLDVLILNAGMLYGPDYTGPYTTSNFPGGDVATMV